MTIHVHIDRLILDGLPLTPGQGPLLGRAVEAELSRLLEEQGVGAGLQSSRVFDRVPGATIRPVGRPEPDGLGRQIAQALYQSMIT